MTEADRHVGSAPRNPLESDPSGVPKKLMFALGAIVFAGLGITLVVLRTSASGWPGPSPNGLLTDPAEMVTPVVQREAPPGLRPPLTDPGPARETARNFAEPTGVVTVPNIGLRAGPSLTAKAVRAVVRENDRVKILKRVSPASGPSWLQIETRSGRVGWLWASVVREGKGKKRM